MLIKELKRKEGNIVITTIGVEVLKTKILTAMKDIVKDNEHALCRRYQAAATQIREFRTRSLQKYKVL